MSLTPRLLLIDDDPLCGRLLKTVFAAEAILVETAETAAAGLARLQAVAPQVLILDLHLPDGSGIDVLEELQRDHPDLPVVILTGRVDVKTAVQAMQLGAFHYLTKPMDREELVLVVRRALERRALLQELAALRRNASPAADLERTMGPSAAIRQVIEQVQQVAPTDLAVLILGETGTGKELVAQAIHRQSARAAQPLIAVDCGAIPDTLMESELFGHEKGAFTGASERRHGQFQLAQGGSLFLDEIGNLPWALQPKLLRVLESREVQAVGASRRSPVDVRIIAATNVDLFERVQAGEFREDLYYRLAQFPLRLPPLRERAEDVPHLALRFAAELSLELKCPIEGFAADAMQHLQNYAWPGNVRELRNIVRQALVRRAGRSIDAALIESLLQAGGRSSRPSVATAAAGAGELALREIAERAAQAAERAAICAALRAQNGNKSAVAKQLQTDYKTLHGKIRRLRIEPADYQ